MGSRLAEAGIPRDAKTLGARLVMEKIGPFGTKAWILAKSAVLERSEERIPASSRYRQ